MLLVELCPWVCILKKKFLPTACDTLFVLCCIILSSITVISVYVNVFILSFFFFFVFFGGIRAKGPVYTMCTIRRKTYFRLDKRIRTKPNLVRHTSIKSPLSPGQQSSITSGEVKMQRVLLFCCEFCCSCSLYYLVCMCVFVCSYVWYRVGAWNFTVLNFFVVCWFVCCFFLWNTIWRLSSISSSSSSSWNSVVWSS